MNTLLCDSQSISMKTDFTSNDRFTVESPRPLPNGTTYREETVIGNGAYGTVYKARDLSDPSKFVALKKVRIPLNEDGVPVSILREISLVRQLERFQHPNVVRFLDICHGRREGLGNMLTLFLVFEYVEMDLSKYISVAGPEELTITKIKDITFQLLCGVDFLHSQRIVHRDLKPQNLLISRSTGQLKLADFGLAKIYDFTMRLTSVVVTLWYRSPEVLLGSTYGTPVDLWSVGCIFAELYRRKPIFPGDSERDELSKIFDIIGTPLLQDWPEDARILPATFDFPEVQRPVHPWEFLLPGICSQGKDLLSKLLRFNSMSRISANDALKLPFFNGRTAPTVSVIGDTVMESYMAIANAASSPAPTAAPAAPHPVVIAASSLANNITNNNNNKSAPTPIIIDSPPRTSSVH